MHDHLEWDLDEDQLCVTRDEMRDTQDKIRKLPRRTRELLVSIINRAGEPSWHHEGVVKAPHAEIMFACDITEVELMAHIDILKRYGIGDADDDEYEQPSVQLFHPESNWQIWTDLKIFCEETGVPLSEIVVDLQFHLLD